MMVEPTVTELLEKIDDNRYSLIIMASKRARQLASGAPALTNKEEKSYVTLAADEIEEGKVMKISDDEESTQNEVKKEEE